MTTKVMKLSLTAQCAKPHKVHVPPITIFNKDREQIADYLKKLDITQYSLKNLRHAIHLYCDSPADFKLIRSKMAEDHINNYSHDMKEEKLFRVALKGLHLMSLDDLNAELLTVQLEPVNIRIIIPKSPRYANDVVYIASLKPDTI